MLSDLRKDIVLTMADSNMNLCEVARKLYFSRRNIDYHCLKICEKTGLNPKNFYDLIKLVEMVKGGDDDDRSSV